MVNVLEKNDVLFRCLGYLESLREITNLIKADEFTKISEKKKTERKHERTLSCYT